MATADIASLLETIATATYAIAGAGLRPGENDSVLELSWYPRSPVGRGVDLDPCALYRQRDISAHQRMRIEICLADRRRDMEALLALIEGHVPALPRTWTTTLLKLVHPSTSGRPRFRLEINETPMTSAPVTIPTLVKRIDGIASALSHVPKPEGRHFIISDRLIAAASPQDALRIYAALARPHAFDGRFREPVHVDIAEWIDAKAIMDELLAA